jgi:hypothetical protein
VRGPARIDAPRAAAASVVVLVAAACGHQTATPAGPAAGGAPAAGTTPAPAAAPADPDEGFVSIWNGRDFSGWAGPVENYEVIDGALACKPGKGGTIYTVEEYVDFVVRLEFRLPPGGNNGLVIRYPGSGDGAYAGMCELQVLDDTHPKYAGLDERQFHGSA